MERKLIIAGNWKMNKTVSEAVQFVTAIKRELFDEKNVEIVVCPVFTALDSISELIEGSHIELGAQDMFWEVKGAFTGSVSPLMLKELKCKYVIIGHSERRKYFGETNETVNKKIKSALKVGLKPIVCVGETQEQREKGITKEIVGEQLREGFDNITDEEMLNCVIAYEPIWAIGTGLNATPLQAEEVHAFIRNDILKEKYGDGVSNSVRIQYGGSVKPDNVKELMSQTNIDGALVGGASLKEDSFCKIVRYYA